MSEIQTNAGGMVAVIEKIGEADNIVEERPDGVVYQKGKYDVYWEAMENWVIASDFKVHYQEFSGDSRGDDTKTIEVVDNEYSVTMKHPMSKGHYISFIAYVTPESCEVIKLYPEQDISVRFRRRGHGMLYAYCNRHEMFKQNL